MKKLLFCLMMLIPLMVQAQHKSVWNIPAADYPSLDDHNMVTFKVYAPDAKDVKISISEKEYPMQKDSTGTWTYTSAPQAVGFHYYFLIYDNYSVKPSAELVGRLRHQILMLNKGDVNQDSFITIADVTALVNIILGKASSSTENVNNAADVNDDDAITIADVTALVNIILGK